MYLSSATARQGEAKVGIQVMRKYQWAAAAAFLVFVASLGAGLPGNTPPAARALACVVVNANDVGAGSLRAAMEDSDCSEITFAPGVTGTISLATDLPSIDRALTITGPGAGALTLTRGTINSTNTGIKTIAGGVAMVSGLTVTNTRNCAEVDGGSLTLSRMVIHSCYHGAESFSGTLNVDETQIYDNPSSAITGGGTINVNRSYLATSHDGILIYVLGTQLSVTNSTISENGFYNIFAAYGPATILNNTFTGSFTGLGVFAGTSGSVIQNNLFAGGTSNCGRSLNETATFTNNISDAVTNCFDNGVDGNQVIAPGTAGLATLGLNGGPTPTFALTSSSPAVDAGLQATCIAAGAGKVNGVDQRGISRTSGAGAHCDIGAFERSSTCYVTSNADTPTGGTLREKMADTSCSTILFEMSQVVSPILFSTLLPAVSRSLAITGPGSELLTIDAGVVNLPRFFDATSGDFSVHGLTLRTVGEGIQYFGGGSLLLDDVDITSGGIAINAAGTTTITDSTIVGVFAGVSTGGTTTIARSSISADLIGLNAVGPTVVRESTLSGAEIGIGNQDKVTVINSTLSGNDTGLANFPATEAVVRNSTIAGNGIGITLLTDSEIDGTNVILANGVNCNLPSGPAARTFQDSIASTGECFTDGVNGSVVLPAIEIGLDPAGLQDNGGPTETIALVTLSPAVDGGDDATCTATGPEEVSGIDQRGVGRPQGDHCDIGAFEVQRECVVTNAADTPTGGTLRQHMANETCAVITFDLDAMGTETIATGSNLPTLTREVDIIGPGARNLIVSSTLGSDAFTLGPGAALDISGLSVSNGDYGFKVESADATLTMDAVLLNFADLMVTGGRGTVTNSTFRGSDIRLVSGTLDVVNSTIADNYYGLRQDSGQSKFTNTTFSYIVIAFNVQAGTATLTNTFMAAGQSCLSAPGTIVNGGNNLADDASCFANGENASIVTPKYQSGIDIGGLANNGGPTDTVLIAGTSPGINAGNNAVCSQFGIGLVSSRDQRGVTRPIGPRCDIGALEMNPPSVAITLAPAQPNGLNGWYRSGVTVSASVSHPQNLPGTLRCAIDPGSPPLSYEDLPAGPCVLFPSLLFSGDGVHVVYAAAKLDAGDISGVISKTFRIDQGKPTVTLTGPTQGASYLQGSVPPLGCITADPISGVATNATGTTTGGNAWGGGSFTATCAGGIDVAGNVSLPVSVTYNVTCLPTRTYQGIVSVKVNAALSLPRAVTVVVNQDVNSCAFKSATVTTNPANQQGAIQVNTSSTNWKSPSQTGADQWLIGVKTANATTGGVYLNNAFRALNGSTNLTLKFLNGRAGLYLKLAGMAPTGVGTTLAGIEAETSVPLVEVTLP